MSVSAKPAREPFQLPERATAEPRQSAPLRCQCRWLECGLRPLLPPVLAPFPEVKVEVWQNERKQGLFITQLSAALCEPSHKKAENAILGGSEEPHSVMSSGECVEKPQIHLGRVWWALLEESILFFSGSFAFKIEWELLWLTGNGWSYYITDGKCQIL